MRIQARPLVVMIVCMLSGVAACTAPAPPAEQVTQDPSLPSIPPLAIEPAQELTPAPGAVSRSQVSRGDKSFNP
ncbi:MAG: hypothetical protein AB7O38_10600 [Pirellulaceae bacterium]